jgi:hypothetical protein
MESEDKLNKNISSMYTETKLTEIITDSSVRTKEVRLLSSLPCNSNMTGLR